MKKEMDTDCQITNKLRSDLVALNAQTIQDGRQIGTTQIIYEQTLELLPSKKTTSPAFQKVTIVNKLSVDVIVYSSFMEDKPTDPPSTNAPDYYPVYTLLGTVTAMSSQTIETIETLSRLVIARKSDQFPVKLYVPPLLEPNPSVSVTDQDQANCENAWVFFQAYASQPYSPIALQFNEILLTITDITTVETSITQFLKTQGYTCDYFDFSLVSYWAGNSLSAYSGVYTCYEPKNNVGTDPFVLPTTPVGQIRIDKGTAHYTPSDGEETRELTYSNHLLTDSQKSGEMKLTGVLRSLTWEGQATKVAMCFTGKFEGKDFFAQPIRHLLFPGGSLRMIWLMPLF